MSQQEFIDKNAVVDFINHELKKDFTSNCFVDTYLENQSKLKAIGVASLELNNVDSFFDSNFFTKTHRVIDNPALIKYLKFKSDNDETGKWFQKLKRLAFIFDERSIPRNPSTGVCFPIELSSPEIDAIPKIHKEVFVTIQSDTKLMDWLKELGVKEPSQVSYVTNVIIPGLKTTGFIHEGNFKEITLYLQRLFRERKLDDDVLESLRELKLKTLDGTFHQAQNCYLSNQYNPPLQIEKLIKGLSFVSPEYLKHGFTQYEWNVFFKAIKVKDRIDVETINSNSELPTLRTITRPEWVRGMPK